MYRASLAMTHRAVYKIRLGQRHRARNIALHRYARPARCTGTSTCTAGRFHPGACLTCSWHACPVQSYLVMACQLHVPAGTKLFIRRL